MENQPTVAPAPKVPPDTAGAFVANPLDPKDTLQKMLDGLDLQASVEQTTEDGQILLKIRTDEAGRLIGKQGQALSQLQFLLNRILHRADPAALCRVRRLLLSGLLLAEPRAAGSAILAMPDPGIPASLGLRLATALRWAERGARILLSRAISSHGTCRAGVSQAHFQ